MSDSTPHRRPLLIVKKDSLQQHSTAVNSQQGPQPTGHAQFFAPQVQPQPQWQPPPQPTQQQHWQQQNSYQQPNYPPAQPWQHHNHPYQQPYHHQAPYQQQQRRGPPVVQPRGSGGGGWNSHPSSGGAGSFRPPPQSHQGKTELLVRNVSPRTRDDDLRALASEFGELKSVKVLIKNGVAKEMAFLTYHRSSDASLAIQGLSGRELHGRFLVVLYAEFGGSIQSRFFAGLTNEQLKGIQMDKVSEYSVTERELAIATSIVIASLLKLDSPIAPGVDAKDCRITDGCACVGGNVLAFAENFGIVDAIELDEVRAKMLKNNMNEVMNLKNVNVFQGDYLTLRLDINKLPPSDVLFFDPPWGGRNYDQHEKMRLNLGEVSMGKLCKMLAPNQARFDSSADKINASDIGKPSIIALKLPMNFDVHNLLDELLSTTSGTDSSSAAAAAASITAIPASSSTSASSASSSNWHIPSSFQLIQIRYPKMLLLLLDYRGHTRDQLKLWLSNLNSPHSRKEGIHKAIWRGITVDRKVIQNDSLYKCETDDAPFEQIEDAITVDTKKVESKDSKSNRRNKRSRSRDRDSSNRSRSGSPSHGIHRSNDSSNQRHDRRSSSRSKSRSPHRRHSSKHSRSKSRSRDRKRSHRSRSRSDSRARKRRRSPDRTNFAPSAHAEAATTLALVPADAPPNIPVVALPTHV